MRIAVVGDLMVNRSVFVKAKKICTEAPIPVFEEVGEEWSLGGAAGVAMMCKALGADVLLCGVTGIDEADTCIRMRLDESQIKFSIQGYGGIQTTIKKRYFDVRDGQRQLVARFDRDCNYQLTKSDAHVLSREIENFKPDAVIIQDHGKGVVSKDLVKQVSQGRWPTFIDPCPTTHVSVIPVAWIGGEKEIPQAVYESPYFPTAVIVKNGADGVSCIRPSRFDISAYCEHPVSSCGAGDQFLASLVVDRLQGMDWRDSCVVASKAAAIYVGRHGFDPVTPEEIAAWKNS